MVKPARRVALIGVVAALVVLWAGMAEAGTLYRWQDEGGKTHIGTVIPQESTQLGYEVLDSSTLRVIEVVPPPFTEEQLQEMTRKREAEEAARREKELRERADKTLLDTYIDVDNMVMTRDGQLATLETIIESIQQTVARLQANLDQQIEAAAAREREGKKPSKKVLQNIADAKEQIQAQLDQVEAHRARQEEIRQTFTRDIERFKELTGQR